jgi:succinylglutamate desuccinylase
MNIILNIGTHGDEKIGFAIAKELEKLKLIKRNFTVQIANKKACELNKRYVDQDLNRSFPGKQNGNHEQKLAYTLSPIIKSADIVIDIHSTTSDLKDALIVTKINKKTLEYIKIIQPKYVLIMSATKNNALISQAKVGIAFEYGKDKDQLALKKIVSGIKKLLKHLGLIEHMESKSNVKTSYFNVTSVVPKPKGYKLSKTVKNYKLVKKGQVYARQGKEVLVAKNDFYPILFGEKNYDDIFGFAGEIYPIKGL